MMPVPPARISSWALPLAVAAALAATAQPAAAAPDTAPEVVDSPAVTAPTVPPKETDRVIVKFRDTGTAQAVKERTVDEAADDALATARAKTPEVVEHVKTTTAEADVVKLDRELSEKEQEEVVAELEADPAVEYAEPDRLATAAWMPNDPLAPYQWSINRSQGGVSFPSAWDRSRGYGKTIAVLDTGITSHPDLNTKVVPGRDFISDPALSRDGNGRDANPQDEGDWSAAGECTSYARNSSWHGTHVAGLAAASTGNGLGVAGAAPGAKIQPVRVLGKCTNGWQSDISDAIVWASGGAVAGQPSNPNRASVINLSLNYYGACSATMQNAINSAVGRNTAVVVAAGNYGVDARQTAPANCNNAIVVGASNNAGTTASYSNIGPNVDILAPGGTATAPMLSTVNTGSRGPVSGGYGNQYGTSMAAPLVAGTVALMQQANSSLTPARIEQVLTSTASGPLGTLTVNPDAAVRAVAPVSQTKYTVTGGIRSKWLATGGAGRWGQPVMNEANAANGGRYQEFVRNGRKTTIFWHRSSGANILENSTAIGRKWIVSGRERNYGFPSTDERRVTGGAYQVYRNGSAITKVLWSSRTGAHAIKETGAIGRAWQRAGYERGWGYPVTSEYTAGGHVQQRFSNGVTAHWASGRGVWTTR